MTRIADVIVDRLVRGKDSPQRTARLDRDGVRQGLGRCRVLVPAATHLRTRLAVRQCGTDHLEPEPNLFRYNSPLGACPRCEGFGRVIELDLERIVPDPSRTIRDGAIAPWTTPPTGACSRAARLAAGSASPPTSRSVSSHPSRSRS